MRALAVENALDNLAVFGGPRAFAEPLYVGRPNIGDRGRLLARINDLLDRRWLTNDGPFVAEFEERIAALSGVRHCIAMCNGTIALEIAARACGLSGEVIVPSFTFVATAHALRWQEIQPVFCDVDPRTCNLDPSRVEELITPRTTGILGVHLWGRPCDADALCEIADRRGLRLLFDAAHAFGCSYRGRPVGTLGDVEVLSFHATKFLNTFEGGAVLTDDDDLAARMRLMKNFGFADYDKVVYLGTNGKMNEVSAAMGLTSLESLDELIAVNRRNYHCYLHELDGVPGISVMRFDETEKGNFQYIVLDVDEERTGLGRDALQAVLHAENVFARRYFYPGCHRMEPYRTEDPDAGCRLPVTERLAERVLSLPTGTAIAPEDVRTICRIVRLVAERGAEVRARMSRMRMGG
jgi:dTDP-4-amino-4,6-dideoxygalactose transaminase